MLHLTGTADLLSGLKLTLPPRQMRCDLDVDLHAGLRYSVFTFPCVGKANSYVSDPDSIGWFVLVVIAMLTGQRRARILISKLYAIASRR